MTDKEAAKKRSQVLKELRTEHKDTVARTQALLKTQNKIQREICKFVREEAKTVPEVAEAINLPTHETLWYLTALKKYDTVGEAGMCGEYVLYKGFPEVKK